MNYRFSLILVLLAALCTSCQCTRDIDIEGQILESCENPVGVEGVSLRFDHGEGTERVSTDANGRFHFQFTTDIDFNIWGSGPEIRYSSDSAYGTFDLPREDHYDYGDIYLNHTEDFAFEFTGIPQGVDIAEFDSLYIYSSGPYSQENSFALDKNIIVNGYISNPVPIKLGAGKLGIFFYCFDASRSGQIFSGAVNYEGVGFRCFDEPVLVEMQYFVP